MTTSRISLCISDKFSNPPFHSVRTARQNTPERSNPLAVKPMLTKQEFGLCDV